MPLADGLIYFGLRNRGLIRDPEPKFVSVVYQMFFIALDQTYGKNIANQEIAACHAALRHGIFRRFQAFRILQGRPSAAPWDESHRG